jgi:hypothetical protein
MAINALKHRHIIDIAVFFMTAKVVQLGHWTKQLLIFFVAVLCHATTAVGGNIEIKLMKRKCNILL